ncbi:MAG: Na+/H+ antiporter subunit E [Candidatus Thermoplasmatota archaeon]
MKRIIGFIVTSILSFIVYLLFTTGSGSAVLGLWSIEECIIGIILSLIIGYISYRVLVKDNLRMLNPVRWFVLLAYLIGPFFLALCKANLDVAYRVITGRIRPGIVRISPGLKTDLGVSMLANSITLTPGTLSVDVDEESNDLYVHWINVDERSLESKPVDYHYICGSFPDWVRRIAE